MPDTLQHHDLDVAVLPGDPLEHCQWPEAIVLPLDDERRTADRQEGRLVVRSRPIRRRNRMTKHHQRIGRLNRCEARGHPPSKRPPDESDLSSVELVSRPP